MAPSKKKDSPKKQQAKGSWKQFKGQIQEKWGELTGDDIERFEGKRDRLEGYIQKKTGEKREVIQKKLDAASEKVNYNV